MLTFSILGQNGEWGILRKTIWVYKIHIDSMNQYNQELIDIITSRAEALRSGHTEDGEEGDLNTQLYFWQLHQDNYWHDVGRVFP